MVEEPRFAGSRDQERRFRGDVQGSSLDEAVEAVERLEKSQPPRSSSYERRRGSFPASSLWAISMVLSSCVLSSSESRRRSGLSQRPQRQAEMQAALRDGSAVHHDPRGSVSTGVRDYVSPTPVVTVSPMIEAARIPAFAAPVMMAERIAVKPVSLLTPQTLMTNCHAA
jgi:hypothetical protein